MKKRIVVVTTVPETLSTILNGQPRYLDRFFEVHLVTSPSSVLTAVAERESVPVHAVSMRRGISPLRDLRSVYMLYRVLRRVRPDVVHSYTPKAGLVAALAGWMARVPVRIHTFTGLLFPSARGLARFLFLQVDRVICACVTHAIPEGNGVRRDLERARVTGKPLNVIGFGNIAGVDTSYFQRRGYEKVVGYENRGPVSACFVFVYVGRLNSDKGISELVAAFDDIGEEALLLLIGAVDESAPVDDQTMERIRTHERIEWIGFQEDIRPALCMADVLVLPSYREGFPNVLLQAGAMELPVIATDVNGSNEIIEEGFNGWLVPARSVAALADAMRAALFLDISERKAMGQRARARVKERFERDAYQRRLLDFYRSALNRT